MRKLIFVASLLLGALAFGQDSEELTLDTTPVVEVVSAKGPCEVLTKDNSINMNDYFSGESVANLNQQMKDLDSKLPTGEPLCLVLNSGGGSIEAGIEGIQNSNTLNRPVHTVTLFAASMGFQTVQGISGLRLITKNGTLMSHKARGFFYGEFPGQLDSRYSHYLKRVTRLDQDVVARTNGKHTAESYARLIENEYWCDGADCIAEGMADRVINPSCDQSLSGQHTRLYDRWLYMGHVIEIVDTMSNCPLITEPLNYNIFIDGEPLFNNLVKLTDVPKAVNSEFSIFGIGNNYDTNKSAVSRLGLETMQNIKVQIESRLDDRKASKRPLVRYY